MKKLLPSLKLWYNLVIDQVQVCCTIDVSLNEERTNDMIVPCKSNPYIQRLSSIRTIVREVSWRIPSSRIHPDIPCIHMAIKTKGCLVTDYD